DAYLRRVLLSDRDTAVEAETDVGIDDDLASGQTAVPLRPAHGEAARRIDVIGGLAVAQVLRDHRADDVLEDVRAHSLDRDVGAMLRRDHDRVDLDRLVTLVQHRYLGFSVGAYPVE